MVNIDFIVVDGLKVESIIGLDFLGKYGCIINLQERVLLFRGTSVPLHNTTNGIPRDCRVRAASVPVSLLQTVTIPPHSELEVVASADIGVDGAWFRVV